MAIDIVLPQLGVEMTAAILAEWTVADDAEVVPDEVVAVVETDKVTYEIVSPSAGRVRRVATEGDEYPVGAVLATLSGVDGKPSAGGGDEKPSAGGERGAPILATPLARRIAKNADLSLAAMSGTGRRGQITRADVEAAMLAVAADDAVAADESSTKHIIEPTATLTTTPTATPIPGSGTAVAADPASGAPLTPMRRTIAARMLESMQTTAQMTDVREIDVGALMELRREMLEQSDALGFRPSINSLFLKAAALALRDVPELNISFVDGRIHQHSHVHLGIAVAVPDGLVVPVIRDADQLPVRRLQVEVQRLSELARARRLTPADMADGSFTVTNIGSYGSHFGTPVLNPPQVAVLATGVVLQRPVVRDGDVVVGDVAHFSLTVDHQVVDGETVGRFHGALTRALSAPFRLLVD